jgi:O-antigen ligase
LSATAVRTGRAPTVAVDDSILLPVGALGALGGGLIAATYPLAGAGLGVGALVTSLPWFGLLTVLALTAVFNKFALSVGGLTVRAEELILIPFAFRAYVLTRPTFRLRWRLGEWSLLGYVLLQVATSFLHSPKLQHSLLIVGLLTFGALAYHAVFTSICTRERLLRATKLILWIILFGAAAGLLAALAHVLFHTTAGLNAKSTRNIPTVHGLAYENNIYGSGSAAGAIAYLILMRNDNPLFSRRFSLFAFMVCFVAMVASYTRGAWIAFVVALIGTALFKRRSSLRPRRPERVAVALFLVGVAVPAFLWFAGSPTSQSRLVASLQDKANTILNFQEGSGRARASEWRIATSEAFTRSPWIGLGTNSYGQRHLEGGQPAYLGNLYIRSVYDSGILGLLLLLGFLIPTLWPRRALRVSAGDLAPVARALVFMWGTLAVAFAGTDSMYLMWPWILLGVTRAGHTLARRQYQELRRPAGVAPGVNGRGSAVAAGSNGQPNGFGGRGNGFAGNGLGGTRSPRSVG